MRRRTRRRLLATTNASNAYLAGVANPIGPAQTAAAARFTAQAGTLLGTTISGATVKVTQSGTLFTSSVSYQGAVQTTLGQLFGVTTMAVTGASSASLSINPYVDIQVLMGRVVVPWRWAADAGGHQPDADADPGLLAQRQAAQQTSHQGESCAFACHWTASGDGLLRAGEPQQRAAPHQRGTQRGGEPDHQHQTRKAARTRSAWGCTPLARPSARSTRSAPTSRGRPNALSQIVPDVNDCSSNCPDTYFSAAMGSLAGVTGTSGNGSTQALSQKFLFIVTDGVVDQNSPGRVIQTVQQADCKRHQGEGGHHPDALHALPAPADQRLLQPVRGAYPAAGRPGAAGLRQFAHVLFPGQQRQRHRRATPPHARQRAADVGAFHPVAASPPLHHTAA